MTRLLISAGEPSGDAHASNVVAALRRARPELELEAVGGPRIAQTGVRLLERIERLSATGLVEAAGRLPAHVRLLGTLRQRLRAGRYDLAILVDYPGFHLRVARAAAAAAVPVLYYIAPQLWAWGAWRARELRRTVRALAVILPFEEAFFLRHGIPTRFVGHPLLDRPEHLSRAAAREAIGVPGAVPLVALFPGSRPQEVHRHWPVYCEAARQLRSREPHLRVVAAGAPDQTLPDANGVEIWSGSPATALAAADAVLCKAGTTTLEAALADVPMVVAHRIHPFTFYVARRLVQLPYVGLVNLLAGRAVVPEFVQGAAVPGAIAHALYSLLDGDGAGAREQRAVFAAVRPLLGEPGAASRVAQLALELVA